MAEEINSDNTKVDNSLIAGLPSSKSAAPDDIEKPKISKIATALIGFSIIILIAISCYLLYSFWPIPNVDKDGKPLPGWNEFVSILDKSIAAEQRIIVLVILAGLIGSLIHAGTSFSNYVGQQKLDKDWTWWYILRPFVGVSVALVFYLVFRAGFVTNTPIDTINIYGIMTFAALSGLFTDRAMLKLKEVFETLFQPNDTRGGKLESKEELNGSDQAKS